MTVPAQSELLTPELLAAVGREYPSVVYEVTRPGVRMWARAVGFTDPVFYDVEAARAAGHPDLPAPPGFYGTPVTGPDGYVPGPPIRGLHPELTRSLNAGTAYTCHRDVYAGDTLVGVSSIASITPKHSATLGPILLITRRTVFTRDGEDVAELVATAINY
jgi:hypothetical protein